MKTSLELNSTILDLVGKRAEAGATSDYNAPASPGNYVPQYQQQPPAYPQPAQNYAPPPAPNYAQPQQPRQSAPVVDAPYDDDIPF
jgi:hypothetical protein